METASTVETVETEPGPSADPKQRAHKWALEFIAAKKELEKWHGQAKKILDRFRDERVGRHQDQTRWNFFTANVQTQRALLYGQTPEVSVSRRFSDANDATARVAGELLERMLNSDIARDCDSYAVALEGALDDRLLVGLGNVRVRYVADFEAMEPPEGYEPEEGAEPLEQKSNEDVEVDYVHWKDQLWSAGARRFHEVRWWGFRCQMSRQELVDRFGDIGQRVPLNSKRNPDKRGKGDTEPDPLARADVWEIWDKDCRCVEWYVEGFAQTLDYKEDPLELEGFWPFPRPMAANLTTSTMVPRPDFVLVQDLYDEIDTISTRITVIEKAIRVAGVYNKGNNAVKRLLSEANQNELIPVENWAMLAEKGGLKGVVDWLPLEQIVVALDKLRDYRTELIQALYQLTGMSDIMRGQSSETAATATEQSIKARFASVRMQAMQDEFARFASDVQKLKAEIISKHFEPETILERSNAQYTWDAPIAQEAVALIKSRFLDYRVEVKPEAVAMSDFAAVRNERSEVVTSIATFMQGVIPLLQMMPSALPYVLKTMQWMVSGLRGSSEIEGVLDQAIQAAQMQAQQPQQAAPPDPKMLQQAMKSQQDQQKAQMDAQADLLHMQAETAALKERDQNRAVIDITKQTALQKIKAQHATVAPLPGGGL